MSLVSKLEILGIEVKTPLQPDWDRYSGTYNYAVPVTPYIVILPATIQQVSQAVRCADEYGFKVQARSGGHSYASHSNGGVDGSVIIDLRKFQEVYSYGCGAVRVGGGARLGNIATDIFALGGKALAHGTCPNVGIGGHFTHGGFGMQSRAWGLAMDQIVALDIVLADGEIVKASESMHRIVFAAMRGAADSFGIIVNFYLRTQQAPDCIIKWTISMPEAMKSADKAAKTFQQVQDFANNPRFVDRRLGLVVFLNHDRFTLQGTWLGRMHHFVCRILWPLLYTLQDKTGIKVVVQEHPWLECLREFAGGNDLRVSGYGQPQCFFAKSAAIAHPGLSQNALENYFKYLLDNGPRAPVDYFISAQLYGGADSRITAHSEDDCFGHRDAMWMFQHYGSITSTVSTRFPMRGILFLEDLNLALGPEHGATNNYADPSLSRDEALQRYYGMKLYALIDLKGKLDPRNLFWHPQSVPLEFCSIVDDREETGRVEARRGGAGRGETGT